MSEWLESTKAGDRVIVVGRHGDGRSIRQVSRTTATRIMVNIGGTLDMKFRRDDGHEVGGSVYGGMQLEQATPEAMDAVIRANRRARLARELNHRNWDNLPLETLEAVRAILPPTDKGNVL